MSSDTDTRTANEIERDIERERAQLANTVDELQDRFSPETIMREVARGFSEHGGDLGRSIRDSVKQNPVALTLTGIGLAWMMLGRSHDDRGDTRIDYDHDDDRRPVTRAEPLDPIHRRAASDRYTHTSRRPAFTSARRYDDNADWAYADIDDDYDDDDGVWDKTKDGAASVGDSISSGAGSAADAAKSAGSSVASGAKSAAGAVGSGAKSAADAVGSGAAAVASGASSAASGVASGVGNAASGVSNAASAAARRAARTRARLAAGTESLTEEAREKVIAARERFVEARRRADMAARKHASRGADAVGDFIEEQPLVAGALAMAVGAALAGALPRTRQEDEMFGAKSDELYDDAERIFQRETAKARKVANAAVSEATDIAREKHADIDSAAPGRKSAVEQAADEVREAGKRVADKVKSEADKQDLGKPDS